jgi:hypothetical protein
MGSNELIGMIVAALGTILGVGVTIVKPILQVVKTMTELNDSINNLADKFGDFETSNSDAHKRIWRKTEEQDEKLQDHEKRIYIIENRDK